MHDKDYYKSIGFRCGLEIHQRLSTEHKLFCECSTDSSGDRVIGSVERRQRAVVGELGAMDRSTSFESSRNRSFVYNIFKRSSCLVDVDEEPPHHVNMRAVEAALRFASAFNARIPDEIEPMRKEVVDGSDPSAFQRSMMVAYDGTLEIGKRGIPITSIFLEEESSGIVSTKDDTVAYNIDRIGIPLIEIDTDPSISSPQEAKEAALKIGLLLRLTGKKEGDTAVSEVQRGIGTIRQDVNVSIAGGTRVEIKGLQEIDSVDLFIENEIERQLRLIDIKKRLIERHAQVDGKSIDLTEILKHHDGKIVRDALSKGGVVLGARLKGFSGFLGMEINPDRRLGSEVSDYAKMAGVRGIIHSDEDLGKYELSEDTVMQIRQALGANSDDAFILIAADRQSCSKAMAHAIDRARMAMAEVPPETRAVADAKKGNTRFMRPLPGGSRMYPETDSEPIEITSQFYEAVKKGTVYMQERIRKLEKELNNPQIAEQMASSTKLMLYEYITGRVKGVNLVVAATLLEKVRELERSGISAELDRDTFVNIFKRYSEGEITKAAIGEIIKYSPKSASDVERIVKSNELERISGAKLKDMVARARKNGADAMREIMSKHRLNVDGEELRGLIGDKK